MSNQMLILIGQRVRSGTNFIGTTLSMHPDIVSIPSHETSGEFNLLKNRKIEEVFRDVSSKKSFNSGVHENDMDYLLSLYGKMWVDFLREKYKVPQDKKIFIKSPVVYNTDLWQKIFPNAKIILLCRDGRDNVNIFNRNQQPQTNILQITTIARLHWIKGLEYTLEALSKLKNEGIEFEYTIIGDGIEKERLLFAAYQLGIKENVNFVGKLPQTEVKKALEKTDIYLQYSIQEGFCNAVLEAQAIGLLCIVSDAEGLSENVLDKQTGWVIEKRKPELLAQKIKEVMLLSSLEKDRIRTNATGRVQQEFNLEKQQLEFINFYSS